MAVFTFYSSFSDTLSLMGASIGYLGEESTSEILDSEGCLRTGDLCYIDQDRFVYIVDWPKELIKYKGYQLVSTRRSSVRFFSNQHLHDTSLHHSI